VIKEEDDFVKPPVKPKIEKQTKIPKDTRLISEKQNNKQPPSRSKSLA